MCTARFITSEPKSLPQNGHANVNAGFFCFASKSPHFFDILATCFDDIKIVGRRGGHYSKPVYLLFSVHPHAKYHIESSKFVGYGHTWYGPHQIETTQMETNLA